MFVASGRLLRKLAPTFVEASKLFELNWGVPQFLKRLRILYKYASLVDSAHRGVTVPCLADE